MSDRRHLKIEDGNVEKKVCVDEKDMFKEEVTKNDLKRREKLTAAEIIKKKHFRTGSHLEIRQHLA